MKKKNLENKCFSGGDLWVNPALRGLAVGLLFLGVFGIGRVYERYKSVPKEAKVYNQEVQIDNKYQLLFDPNSSSEDCRVYKRWDQF